MLFMESLDITFIDHKLDLNEGGSNSSFNILANQLSDRNHKIKIITLFGNDNTSTDNLKYQTISLNQSRTRAGKGRDIIEVMRKEEDSTDIFHLYQPTIIPFGGFYRKRGGNTPVIGRLNSYSLFCTNTTKMNDTCFNDCTLKNKILHDNVTFSKKVLRSPEYLFRQFTSHKLANYTDRLFALSPAVKRVYESNNVDPTKINVIPNFYDPQFPKKDHYEQPNENDFRILYAGRLIEAKGITTFIKAIEPLLGKCDIVVDILGKGPEKRIIDSIDNCKLRHHGRIPHDEIHEYYQKADLFVHPGVWPDPFPRTILEALQYNTPCLVSDIGGPPWAVGNAGKTFEKGNSDDLNKKLLDIIKNQNEFEKLKNNCESRLEEFSPENIVCQIENKYKNVIEKS